MFLLSFFPSFISPLMEQKISLYSFIGWLHLTQCFHPYLFCSLKFHPVINLPGSSFPSFHLLSPLLLYFSFLSPLSAVTLFVLSPSLPFSTFSSVNPPQSIHSTFLLSYNYIIYYSCFYFSLSHRPFSATSPPPTTILPFIHRPFLSSISRPFFALALLGRPVKCLVTRQCCDHHSPSLSLPPWLCFCLCSCWCEAR